MLSPNLNRWLDFPIYEDRRITVKQLASVTRISVGSLEKILPDPLNLNKVSARWVPRLLTADQKK